MTGAKEQTERSADRVVLAIEASNPTSGCVMGVALGAARPDGSVEVLGEQPLDASRRLDDGLMPAIARLSARIGVRPAQIGAVAISIGPGGYTSVRVSVSVGKMIAAAADAVCVPVPTARVALAASAPSERGGPVAVMLAGKRSSVWCEVWAGRGAEPGGLLEEGLVEAETARRVFARRAVTRVFVERHTPPEIVERAVEAGIACEDLAVSAGACLAVAGVELAKALHVKPAQLLPKYPREPEAVRLHAR